jgi:rhodanese-related sulfurtransferase
MSFKRKPAITAEQAAAGLDNRELTLVDVRAPVELRTGRIRGSVNIPLGQLRARLGELEEDRQVASRATRDASCRPLRRWRFR